MLQTETKKSRKIMFDEYKAKHIMNRELEWLIEEGKIRESVYFKGETGDRYSIYMAIKRNSNIIDFYTIYNSFSHGKQAGVHIGTLRGYQLEIDKERHSWYGMGHTFKQLMRQGVMSEKHPWQIRYCRNAFFVRLDVETVSKGGTVEFTPWEGMKINIKTGNLINKPNRKSVKAYKHAKETDRDQRKRNALANKNNKEALERYKKAGGDTTLARAGWVHDGSNRKWRDAEDGAGTEKINWDMIPMDDIFKHRNATLRSNILEHYGINALLKTLTHDVVDIDFIDKREYKLLNVEIPDESTGRSLATKCLYLEMINPSTGESHFEGIANVGRWNAPREATVKEALAWRDGDRETQNLNGYEHQDTKSVYVVPVKLT